MKNVIIFVITLSLTACAAPAPHEQYYTLGGTAPTTARVAAGAPLVTVGPLNLPELADRPQMVVRASENRVMIAEQHRWAEPLRRAIPRVIADNLAQLTDAWRFRTDAGSSGEVPDYRLAVDIRRFDAQLGGPVTIEGQWTLRRVKDGESRSGHAVIEEPADEGYESLAAAWGRALQRLSRAMVDTLP